MLILLAGCSVKTKNAEKAFEYWYGVQPPAEVQMMNGEYYRSPHFTLEYELFLQFKTTSKWFNEFARNSQLVIDPIKNDWPQPDEIPDWVKPGSKYVMYSKDPDDEFERSRYFIDTTTGMCYIYETVGM